MKVKKAYGLSRNRDKKGKIVKQTLKDYTMCIHANVGGGWKTMMVLVVEVYGEKSKCCTSRQHSR